MPRCLVCRSASHSSVEAGPPPIFSPADHNRAAVFAPTGVIRRLRLINFCLEKQLTDLFRTKKSRRRSILGCLRNLL